MNRYAYFMVRVPRDDPSPPDVCGLVERLDTGQKRAFASAHELLAFIAGADAPTKLESPADSDKQVIGTARPDPSNPEGM